jgi:aminopeptidase N
MYSKIGKVFLLLGLFFLLACSKEVENGVSYQLAQKRAQTLTNIRYHLYFDVPNKLDKSITGRVEIEFEISELYDLPLDFRGADSALINVTSNYRQLNLSLNNGHIIIPKGYLQNGQNKISIDFIAGDASLNRKEDFLYSLLVPDRASTVFPCFDQPDLKATFNLTLQTPKSWKAVSNSPLANYMETDSSAVWIFDKTYPISTYLFAFTAGKFNATTGKVLGQKVTIYHRENDSAKLNRNVNQIFKLHESAITWLEEYIGIGYPFQKLDIILIPDFQYSGMEHPGAIYYRDSRILLDENPSVDQVLRRANLIAHEVSHQWFGNLVTMKWFNDVWLKEVFAGLMADKIVNPQFPNVNHALRFLLSHYPAAYSVDRTIGANPVRQKLDNLLFAGTLYGDIIYHKAPIALMQMELKLGSPLFREGVRQYLNKYAYANAGWPELVKIFDEISSENVSRWSKKWIESKGMPVINYDLSNDKLVFNQDDKWLPMKFNVLIPTVSGYKNLPVDLKRQTSEVKLPNDFIKSQKVIINQNGLGYGFFHSNYNEITLIPPKNLMFNDVARASFYVNLHEVFLNHLVDNDTYFRYLLAALQEEVNPLVRSYLLGNIETVWWRFFNNANRTVLAETLENTLANLYNNSKLPVDERKPILDTYFKVAFTEKAISTMEKTWEKQADINGITLSETDFINLSFELAVRNVNQADSILQIQEERIKNPDRLSKFRFVRRAATPNVAIRDDFFASLANPANRRPEPWVAQGLRYFFHPLREEHSFKYLQPALDLLPEIQETNDIFFPKIWLDNVLAGFNSPAATRVVTDWLNKHPNISPNLKNKMLQSADLLFRAADAHKLNTD